MPAPAVIPAPIAYIKVAVVKKLVVGFWGLRSPVCREVCTGSSALPYGLLVPAIKLVGAQLRIVYFEKIRVFKAGILPEYSSMKKWNRTRLLFCWFLGAV